VVSSGKSHANAIHVIYCFQDSQLLVVAFQELLAVVLSMASSAVQGEHDMVLLRGVLGNNLIIQTTHETAYIVMHVLRISMGVGENFFGFGHVMQNLSS